MGGKRHPAKKNAALVLVASPVASQPPEHRVVPFATDAQGDALIAAIGEVVARRAAR